MRTIIAISLLILLPAAACGSEARGTLIECVNPNPPKA